MGVMVLLARRPELGLGPGTLRELARFGVTSVSVVSGGGLRGFVFEGWSFEPGESAADVREILDCDDDFDLLLPELQFAVRKIEGEVKS